MTESESAMRARQYYQQGVAFAQRGAMAEAEEALRAAVRMVADHIEARIHLARVVLRRGRAAEGLRILNSGLSRKDIPDDDRARLLQTGASCASADGQYSVAREYLEKALKLGDSQEAAVLNKVAAVCCKGGEFETGFDYFLKASHR